MILSEMEPITWQEFEQIELRVGTIIEASDFPQARNPSYKLKIDFGEFGIKKSSAQITELYTVEELVGKQVLAVLNFPPKQIGPYMSECLTTGVEDEEGRVILLSPDHKAVNGSKLF